MSLDGRAPVVVNGSRAADIAGESACGSDIGGTGAADIDLDVLRGQVERPDLARAGDVERKRAGVAGEFHGAGAGDGGAKLARGGEAEVEVSGAGDVGAERLRFPRGFRGDRSGPGND